MFVYKNPKKRYAIPLDLLLNKKNKEQQEKENNSLETNMVDGDTARESSFLDIASKIGNQKMRLFIKSFGNLELFSKGEDDAELDQSDPSMNVQGKPKKQMRNELKNFFPYRVPEIGQMVSKTGVDDNLREPVHPLKGDWIRSLFKGLNQMGNGLKSKINGDEEHEEDVMDRDRLNANEAEQKKQLSDGLMEMISEMSKDEENDGDAWGVRQQTTILKLLTSFGASFTELFKSNGDPAKQKQILKDFMDNE